jgi:deoxyribonuclease-4
MDDASRAPALVYDDADEYRPEPVPEPQQPAWRDGSVRIGIHTSIAGDISASLESARKLGCNALQIFSASPRMWPRPGMRIGEVEAVRFRARRAELGLGPLVVHANYLINLASSHPVLRTRSIQAFHDEIVRAGALGADFLVVHPGSALGAAPDEAIRLVAQGLRHAARGIRFTGSLRVLVENTAGMGSAIGARFEELRAILDAAADVPLGVCLDTAHAFAAGYEIRTEAGLAQTIADLDRTVGLQRVAVLHINDSKTPFASRVDRHEHVGLGKIGREAFRRILTHPQLSAGGSAGLRGRAFILETPIDAPGDDRRNVRTLWELLGVRAKQAPRAENGFSMLRKKPPESARGASRPARKKPSRRTRKARTQSRG